MAELHWAFTTNFNGIARVLVTSVGVSLPASSGGATAQFDAIWDTGATNCVITKKVVDALQLIPTGRIDSYHVGGKDEVNKYCIDIILPNNVAISAIDVTEGKFIGGDILIGMDVIARGDFSVTNEAGKTTMSFRMPPHKKIDYIPETNQRNFIIRNGTRKEKKQHGLE